MALSFSGHLQGNAVSWTSASSVDLSVCLGHISASVQHIFTSLNSTRSTPTSALQPLAVPTISTSVERHSLAHVSRVSQTISTTGFVASTVSEWRSAATATSSAAAVVEC